MKINFFPDDFRNSDSDEELIDYLHTVIKKKLDKEKK
jgi:hypothetical protein